MCSPLMDIGAKVPEIEKPFQLPAYVGVRIDEPLLDGRGGAVGADLNRPPRRQAEAKQRKHQVRP